MRLAIVGAGAMGGALLRGWLAAGTDPAEVLVVEPDEGRARTLVDELGVRIGSLADAGSAGTVVVAVKPKQVEAVLRELTPAPGTVVVSIAAGVTLARLEDAVPDGTPVVRVMPNVGALVGEAMSGVIAGRHVTDEQLRHAQTLLDAVGRTMVVDEDQLDALTAVSGSGPAYLFHVADALVEAGVHQGLTRDQATTLAVQTFVGAAQLLDRSGRTPHELREQVTSPAGTTAAALRVLDERGVRAAVLAAAEACAERSAEMGRQRP
ncbi:pyrroline-5-carboxylate reductase [uncultured Tessaracoccus sp.]|uniref:pyrroline-5-carboxylate reductase n=1 Tax=uncultured Tessaracoccus sp. TaxID=905023 RepID=UPI0025CD9F7E|nr:pyrroline-5-carboxylate reductase [uncultured Tessaracoccus sp.]